MSNAPDNPLSPPPAGAPQPPAPAAPAKPAKKADEGPGDASLSQVIDTIEAIIIALIVALTFRAFIVEAFVIPTGSMAPTLLGAHFKAICPECGYAFDLEASLEYQVRTDAKGDRLVPDYANRETHSELHNNSGVPLPVNGAGQPVPTICPNCRYSISASQLPQYLKELSNKPIVDRRPGNPKHTDFAWANNGDRILVLKYLYSIMQPSRWDVIVFKEPQKTQDNYIKRLVGLPGDTLEIINGDVYIWPGSPAEDAKNAANFKIARKPEYIQRNLWQLVYDNDYYPIDADPKAGKPALPLANPRQEVFENPWKSATWDNGPVMTNKNPGPSQLTFNLTPPQALGSPYTLNTLGYNNDFNSGRGANQMTSERTTRSYVGDLRLETTWTPADNGAASVALTLGRPANCYRVEWSAAGIKLRRFDILTSQFGEELQIAAPTFPPPQAGKSYALAMNNVDRSVQFYIDGVKVISYEQPWTAAMAIEDEQKHPSTYEMDAGGLSPGSPDAIIRVDVGGRGTLAHLKLFRDLYYTQIFESGPGNPPTGTEGHEITLRDDEYFALGDNSRRSSDSRFWGETFDAAGDLGLRNGIVPRRYLLGKAFFVYWPAGYRGQDSIPFPLVPNTGDMRIIR